MSVESILSLPSRSPLARVGVGFVVVVAAVVTVVVSVAAVVLVVVVVDSAGSVWAVETVVSVAGGSVSGGVVSVAAVVVVVVVVSVVVVGVTGGVSESSRATKGNPNISAYFSA